MGLTFTDKLDKTDASRRIQDIEAYARGAKVFKYFVEDLGDMQMESIKSSAEADFNEKDPWARAQNTYLRALYRDGQYALMGRKRLFELGVHNGLRETYEKGKQAVDASKAQLA